MIPIFVNCSCNWFKRTLIKNCYFILLPYYILVSLWCLLYDHQLDDLNPYVLDLAPSSFWVIKKIMALVV